MIIKFFDNENYDYPLLESEDKDFEEIKKVLKEYPDSKIVIPGHGEFGNLNIVRHTLNLLKNKK